jgi:hypothetical protein
MPKLAGKNQILALFPGEEPGYTSGVIISLRTLVLACLFAIHLSGAEHPNIVLIYADDLGYGDVDVYHPGSKIPTPQLNRLAEAGMVFRDGHSASTVCTPSRYAVMTGRLPFRTGFRGVFKGVEGPCLIPSERLTLPELLQAVGYHTALMGKWHIGATFLDRNGQPVYETSDARGLDLVAHADLTRPIADGPLNHGFDTFFGTIGCPTTDYLYSYVDGDRLTAQPGPVRDRSDWPQNPWTLDFREGVVSPDFDFEAVDMVFLESTTQIGSSSGSGRATGSTSTIQVPVATTTAGINCALPAGPAPTGWHRPSCTT